MSSPLSAPALLALLPNLANAASTPALASPLQALTLLLHAAHVALGFRLAPSSSGSTDDASGKLTAEALQKGEIEYRHAQSSLTFVVRIGKLGSRAVVDGMAVEDDKPHHVSFPLATKLAPESSFPYALHPASADKPLVHAFLSEQSLEQVVAEYKREIIDKLVPSLEGKPTVASSSAGAPPRSDPGTGGRAQVNPPGIPAQPPSGSGGAGPRGLPPTHPSLGAADLDPLAASPNLFRPPSLFGGGGRPGGGIVGGGPGGGGGGGMFMDPSQFPSAGDLNPSPRGFHPPGARWDPITPFQPPGGGGAGFHPNVPRAGGPFAGEPDNDEFMPPGTQGDRTDFGIRFPGQYQGGRGGGGAGRGGFGGGMGGGGGGFGGFA